MVMMKCSRCELFFLSVSMCRLPSILATDGQQLRCWSSRCSPREITLNGSLRDMIPKVRAGLYSADSSRSCDHLQRSNCANMIVYPKE
ncbi:hypothetical protein BDV96DRAFT_58928 [Lophiotrema nucula]|uniref:Secreted protein n=1 Tax=Lophiotrema nucula TaxID=690887 RepID=A0A6A5Z8K6_9PLEO|nr:hypothetical protein BDV96DRAFT_58928 [Lophiotrema nucula]